MGSDEDAHNGDGTPEPEPTAHSGAADGNGSPDRREAAARLTRLRRAAVRLDTNPRGVAAARALRSVLPGDDRFGDPLSTAGKAPVEVIARGVTALREEPDSVLREVGLTGLQLWQSLSEKAGRGRGDHEMAIVFTDLVGFSDWALEVGDASALELLRAVGAVVEAALVEQRGRIVKRLGDGLMATFLDADCAVAAVLRAQDAVADIEVEGYRPRMRAGVHWGRPRKLGGDYLGVDVNVAARVVDAAAGGEMLISETVLDRIDAGKVKLGKAKRLRAPGTPRQLHTVPVSALS
jgi:adenylate cyclase